MTIMSESTSGPKNGSRSQTLFYRSMEGELVTDKVCKNAHRSASRKKHASAGQQWRVGLLRFSNRF